MGGDDPQTPAATSTDLAGYEKARSTVGRDADAHVRLALWCESHGMTAERIKHLSLAVLYDPSHMLARGLMGLVAYHGKWDRPDVVGQQIRNDPAPRRSFENTSTVAHGRPTPRRPNSS